MIHELDTVAITRDLPERGIVAGDIGVVAHLQFAACFNDRREAGYAEHPVHQLVAQRLYGLCLGYEDLNDHEQLCYDPLFAALCEQSDVRGEHRRRERDTGKMLACKSTLQRLESTPAEGAELGRSHRILGVRLQLFTGL